MNTSISNLLLHELINKSFNFQFINFFSYRELISSIKLDSKTLQKIQENTSLPKLRHKKSTSLQSQQAATPNAQGGAIDLPPHVILSSGGVTQEDHEWVCWIMERGVFFFYLENFIY